MIKMNRQAAIRAGLVALLAGIPLAARSDETDRTTDRFIGNWKYICDDAAGCRAFVGLGTAEHSVVAWSIQKSRTTGAISSVLRVPLGVILQAGVRVYTSDDDFFTLAYQICRRDGCSATATLDSAIRAKLGATDTARVVIYAHTPGETEPKGASFELPIAGMADVFRELDPMGN